MAAECSAAARGPSSTATSGRGCGLALGRLVRKLRRQSRLLCTASSARPASSARYCQYDPLSYARNFDFGTSAALEDHSFASRFVLAASARKQQQ